MDWQVVEGIEIEKTRAVTDRKTGRLFRRQAPKTAVVVQFAHIEDRDVVFTYAPELKMKGAAWTL